LNNINQEIKDPLCWKSFQTYYKARFPYLKKLTKRTDFCDLCCRLKQTLNDKKTLPENKLIAQNELENHTIEYSEARKAYSDHRKITAKENGWVVLSLDYAENITLPHLIDQPASFFFKTLKKVDLFGIADENNNSQLNFLIDEGFRIKKGPNSVISMLDYYLRTLIKKGSSLILYCDNCGGQNKNQYLIGYLAYMVKVEKYLNGAELYFMIVGHTKFGPDGNFGTLKRKLRDENVYSITDLIGETGIVQASAKNNFDITYKDPFTGEKKFEWKNWKGFIGEHFKPCTGIRTWHAIKIPPQTFHIQVSPSVTSPFSDYKIMDSEIP